ncbi:gametocyte-specific factor 1 [Brachionichthys hirsutus]|uniref:gametocyte-specific factor 1 n=1 Tax=Brachionichthys hirsutus TaxID=412623 RepID=UPI003604979D
MSDTIRYGTTCLPPRAAAAVRADPAEETGEKGSHDPDELMQCPFDKSHQIRVCRFPYHIIKCRENHPKLAKELKTCPFNARHLIPKHELPRHTETCEYRPSVDRQDRGDLSRFWALQVPASTWQNPNMTEDWDEDADDGALFVWGVNTGPTNLPESRPVGGIRKPATVPWLGL